MAYVCFCEIPDNSLIIKIIFCQIDEVLIQTKVLSLSKLQPILVRVPGSFLVSTAKVNITLGNVHNYCKS